MRVLAYSFGETKAARAARELLIRRFQMRPTDAAVAPLAGDGFVVAVRAREENVPAVKTVLERHGGTPADDLPEEWAIR